MRRSLFAEHKSAPRRGRRLPALTLLAALAAVGVNFFTGWGAQATTQEQFTAFQGAGPAPYGATAARGSLASPDDCVPNTAHFNTKWSGPAVPDGAFQHPNGVAVDSAGNVYVADTTNNRVQKFDADGTFITEWGQQGTGDGEFFSPYGLAVDSAGNVYVSDTFNDRVQKFTSAGVFVTRWGAGGGTGDGQFLTPYGVAVDS